LVIVGQEMTTTTTTTTTILSNEQGDKNKKIKMSSSSTAAGKDSTTKPQGPSSTTTSLSTKIIANDGNPKAIEYFENAIRYNNLIPRDFLLPCQDAYDFSIDLGCTVMEDDPVLIITSSIFVVFFSYYGVKFSLTYHHT
jgi:hypothetical protein